MSPPRAISDLLTPAERRLFARLDTPQKIQEYLDRLPVNFEPDGDTVMSPRRMLKAKVAHCAEGALFAAAVLMFHRKPGWLVDLRARPSDQDHVVAIFRHRGLWGAISKTNHSILRWRDPIYRSVRELVMSYAHEYCLPSGQKSLLAFSRPFSLNRYAPARWVIAEGDLHWLMEALDNSPHEQVAPKRVKQRRSAKIEIAAQAMVEWEKPRKRRQAPQRAKPGSRRRARR
jgi:hypothetical protein